MDHSQQPSESYNNEINQQQNNDLFSIASIDDLYRLYYTFVYPYWLIYVILPVIFVTAAIFYVQTTPKQYEGTCTFNIQNENTSFSGIKNAYDVFENTGSIGGRNDTFTSTQVEIIKSYDILKKAYHDLKLSSQEPFSSAVGIDPLKILQNSVSAKPIPKTTLMTISYRSKDPEQAVRLANAYTKIYIDSFSERQKSISGEGLIKLKNQLENMRQDRESARKKLLAYKQKHQLINLEDAYRLDIEQINNLNSELIKAKANNNLLMAAQLSITQAPNSRLFLLPNLNERSIIPQIQLLTLQHALTRPQKISPADIEIYNSTYTTLNKALESALTTGEHNLVIQIQQNRERIKLIEKELSDIKNNIINIDRITEEYRVLEDIYTVAEEAYRSLAKRIHEVTIADATDHIEGRGIYVTTPAIKAQVVYPRKVRICALALFLSLGLAGGSSLVLGLLNNTVRTRDYLKFIFGNNTPDFGAVPKIENGDEFCLKNMNKQSSFVEDFRLIRSNLNLSLSTRQQSVFLISSAIAQEGKSFTSINLAKTFALEGKKILLIDMDLRRPRIFKTLSPLLPTVKAHDKGISNLLVGDATLEEIIHPIPQLGIDIICCGPIPPNPAELLNEKRVSEIINDAKLKYDVIFIDCAPLLSIPDTRLLASYGYPLLLVARLFKVTQPHIRCLNEELNNLNIQICGFITNCVDVPEKNFHDNNYYYHYHNHYYYSDKEQ